MTGAPPDEAAGRMLLDEVIEVSTGLRLPPDANFFEAGLTSAMLLRVHAELIGRLGADLPVTDLFRFPNRRALARRLVRLAVADPAEPGCPAPRLPTRAGPSPDGRRALRSQIRARTEIRNREDGQS